MKQVFNKYFVLMSVMSLIIMSHYQYDTNQKQQYKIELSICNLYLLTNSNILHPWVSKESNNLIV